MIRKLVAGLVLSCQVFSYGMANAAQSSSVCSSFLTEFEKETVFFTEQNGVCFLGKESLESSQIDIGGFDQLGHVDVDQLGKLKVIGSDGYGAVLVSNGLAHLLSGGNEVLPFILGVLAVDAALIGVMFSSYVDAHIAASQK